MSGWLRAAREHGRPWTMRHTVWSRRLLLWLGFCFLPSSLAMAKDQLHVAGEDQFCEKDADCATVQTDCSGCNPCGTPVNKTSQQKYIEQYPLCAHYSGIVCSAICVATNVVCCHNRCASSPWQPGGQRLQIGEGPVPTGYVASRIAMQFWAEHYGLTPCDFVGWSTEYSVEDRGGLGWRVKGPQRITPPLEIEIDKETGHVEEIE